MGVRHSIKNENIDPLKAHRNECIFPSFTKKILDGITIDPTDLCRYTSGWNTRRLLADKLSVDPEHISMNNGSECVIKSVIESMCRDNANWVVPTPTFELIDFYLHHYGANVETVDYSIDGLSLESIWDKQEKVLFVVSPNNPTGVEVNIHQMCRRFKYVVVDQAYINPLAPMPSYDNLIVVRTFSKMGLMTAMRFGYCYSVNKGLISDIEEIRPNYMPALTLKIADHIIENDLTFELESYIKVSVIPRYRGELGDKLVHFSGNYALVKDMDTYKGYPLKKYIIDDQVYYRVTLYE